MARRILEEDVTQIDYYTERVKRMVGKVLTGNGITRCEKGSYALVGGDELSDSERDRLLALCRQRLDAFRGLRGEIVLLCRSLRLRVQNVTDRVRNREVALPQKVDQAGQGV